MAWSSEAFIAKARCYIERGLEATDDTVRAWWFHFAVEPLVRATVAAIHPALLADPRHVDSLLSAVSTEGICLAGWFRDARDPTFWTCTFLGDLA